MELSIIPIFLRLHKTQFLIQNEKINYLLIFFVVHSYLNDNSPERKR